MIVIYTAQQKAKLLIAALVRAHTDETIVIVENQEDLPEILKRHRPRTALLFMPDRVGTAIDIKSYIRAVLPHCRVRILPSLACTDLFHPTWREVVIKAVKNRDKRHKSPKEKS